MPGLERVRTLRLLLCALVATAITSAITALPSPAQTLRATPATGVVFPEKSFLVSAPYSVALTPGNVHITENGHPVSGDSVTSLPGGGSDLGVVLMIDTDSSMSGAPLDRALGAARTLVAQRSGDERLGVVFGDGTRVPLTANSAALDRALAHPPSGYSTMNLLQMTQGAISELQASRIADRAIIYVTDDIDRGAGYTPRSVGALAASAHVRVFTVGVPDNIWKHPFPQDLPSPQSMQTLAESAGGTYIEAAPSQERAAFSQIAAGLGKQYLVTYRSSQPFGKTIVVSIHVDGVPGVVRLTYSAPPAAHPLPGRSRAPHHGLFWASSTAFVLAALAAALLVGIAVATLAAHFSRAGRLRTRVGEFIGTRPELAQERVETPEKRRSLIDQVLEGRKWWSAFVEDVDISSLTRSPQELVRLAIAASLIGALLLDLFTGSILLAMLGLAAGPILLRALVKRSVRKLRQKFAEQLPGHLHELASAMRTGRSITDGIAIVAESAEEPMRRELQRVIADERAGLHVDEALVPVGSRMESTEIEQVSVIAALHRRTGANITEVLDRIADTARQRVEIRRELIAMTAQARLSRNVLVSMPVFVAIAIDLIGHRYEQPLFHTTLGILVMVIAAMMLGLGAKIMKRFVTVEE